MKTFFRFLSVVLLLAGVICQDTTTADPTDTTPTATDPSTLETTTITDSTTISDATTVTPTTTDAPITTDAPTTASPTTQPPTTTQKTTSTSTPSTPKTTTPPIPTTPSPKPPVAELGSWNVTQDNVTCMRADLKIRFMIPIDGREDYIALSPNATTEGSNCNATGGTQELRLTEPEYVLLLTFDKDDKNVYLKNITLYYNLPGDNGIVYNDTKMFKAKVGNSYLCSNTETVPLFNVSMEIFQIHLQAYGSTADGDFGTADECEADDKVNDIVPIAVGCCLLALVVIVLIAYFVGRRRSRQKGYQSV